MNDINVITALLGGLILLLGLGSRRFEASPVPPTLIALLIGVAVGPAVLGWVDLARFGDQVSILKEAARLTLAVGVVAVGLRIPAAYPRCRWRPLLVLIGLGMPLMWVISTALVYLVLGLDLRLAALIGAALTPTDPVAASQIVSGPMAEKNIPQRIRHAISFDSGANDGLAYLFVFLPFFLLTLPTGEAWQHWLLHTLLWEVGAATACGLLLGWTAGRLFKLSDQHGGIKPPWRLVHTVALGLLAVGVGKLIHSDEILLVFAAACAFVQVVTPEVRRHVEAGQEAVNRFFAIPMFVLLGAAIPWAGWQAMGLPGVLLGLAMLVLRRPLTLVLLRRHLPGIRTWRDTLLVGWFGPIAVAAVYYATMMQSRLDDSIIWHVVSLVACMSVVAHGMTGAALTRRYGQLARDSHQAGEKE